MAMIQQFFAKGTEIFIEFLICRGKAFVCCLNKSERGLKKSFNNKNG